MISCVFLVADDLDYVPQGQAGVVGVYRNPALLDEEESFDERGLIRRIFYEEETQTQAIRASGSTTVSPKDAWDLFISDNIIEEVLKCTNLEGQRAAAAAKEKEQRCIDKEEFMAFIGLTLLAGEGRGWDVALRELFLDPLQNPMYKATMGFHRYEDIRLDDKRTRAQHHNGQLLHQYPSGREGP